MWRLAPSLLIVAAVIGGSAVAQSLNPAPDTNTRLCDLEAIFASIPVYDECSTTTGVPSTTTGPAAPTTVPPSSTYDTGVWSLNPDGTGPIWTPPQDEDGLFRWYPNVDGARIAWFTSSGEWDWGSRGPDGFDATGPLEDSEFHYWDNGWVAACGLDWRVDGVRGDGTAFEEFWVAPPCPVYEADPLIEPTEPATCFAQYPCVVPTTTMATYPTTGPT